MQSRRDQVQAHLFVMGRLSSGILRNDPDAPDPPTSRTWRGVLWGILVAAVACAVTAVYGLVSPGGATSWRTPGALVVVRETGARYLSVDGALHPVLNEASARLVAGDQLTVQQVAAASVKDAPRGPAIGIVGAPDGLPDAPSKAPWEVCAGQRTTASGRTQPTTGLLIGPPDTGGGLAADRAVLVDGGDGGLSVLWNGRRHRLDDRHGVRAALGFAGIRAVPVRSSFLTALDAGPDLAPPHVAHRGTAGPRLAGRATRVGQLFTSGGHHYLLRGDGLVPLTPLARTLLRGDPRTQADAYRGGAVTERALGPADLAAHQAPASAAGEAAGGLPSRAPKPERVDPAADRVCARLTPTAHGRTTSVTVTTGAALPGSPPDSEPGVRPARTPVDRIWARPGAGALVRAQSSAGRGGTRYLVADSGAAYPVPSDAALKKLGYPASAEVRLPARLLDLLPSGPVLDPAALESGGVVTPSAAPPAQDGKTPK